MPALITHHLFGEHAAKTLDTTIISDQESLFAFLLGNQGPDPFFFHFRGQTKNLQAAHTLASRMHSSYPTQAFLCLREGVSHLVQQDQPIGRAFVLGLLAHYQLDRCAHPFVYAQQYALTQANQDLRDGQSETHAVIEADIDAWLLLKMRNHTILDCPAEKEIITTERINRVASALMSYMAQRVFGITLYANTYGDCVSDMKLVYKMIEPAGSHNARAIAKVERRLRPHSQLASLAHPVLRSLTECQAVNLEHNAWQDPGTHEISHESFLEIFERALQTYTKLSRSFICEDAFDAHIAHYNYEGELLTDDESSVVS